MKTKKLLNNKILLLASIVILLSSCSHVVDLSVTPYSEEALTWCGPATGQMIMASYPPSATSCSELQEDIWASIVSNKVEAMWDTDPEGLRKAMIDMCPPSGTWVIHDDTDSIALMHTVATLMTKYRYPTAAVLNTTAHVPSVPSHTEHWIVIKGFVSDKNPVTNTDAILESVTIIDPVADIFGNPVTEEMISAETWYEDFSTVTKAASSYAGKFVVITEPPVGKGRLTAPREVKRGKIISPQEAIAASKQLIKKYKLTSKKAFSRIKGAEPVEAILADKDYRAYYIVPFAKSNGREKVVEVVMLVNAYDGSMRRVKSFKAFSYIGKEEALNIARERLQIEKPDKVHIELVNPAGIDNNPYFPLHKVIIDNETLFIDQKGDPFTPDRFN